ncbi:hypothetical protein GGD83_000182 [Rhodoblastus sphagnicola]|uniref:hypothetical protein n=1 Tax=Rhodoblastus sphagnicola TaxID=333368 RepID=UPI00182630E8|nr:hypothetical protein [Rhodoblastus sphagnicola]MBB4196411.1 hypothetical protein [Rhodoblastus sphagnicola]
MREKRGLASAGRPGFPQDRRNKGFHRRLADSQFVGYLFIHEASAQEAKNLILARAHAIALRNFASETQLRLLRF